REVKDDITPIDQLGKQRLVIDRVNGVLEARHALEMSDVVNRSGREVVQNEHLMSALEQGFREMGADEACSSRDQRSHVQASRLRAAPATICTSSSLNAG